MSRHHHHSLHRTALATVILFVGCSPTFAGLLRPNPQTQLVELNAKLGGRVVDFTNNHGCDRRIYSPALGEKRSMYVYLPPGYDGTTPFPAMLWLHGNGHDERHALEIAEPFDVAIREGKMPPIIVIAPDGSVPNRPPLSSTGSFWLNSKSGRYEDYAVQDVWGFLIRNFAVRPERDAHAIFGASMGGFGAFGIAFKHRDIFGQIIGVMPVLNVRYLDCHGRYFANYRPDCVSWRTDFTHNRVIGRFYGVLVVREKKVLDPLLNYRRDDTLGFLQRENPVELMLGRGIQPGEFGIFIGYGTKDEFNIDAQVEQFRDLAAGRGIATTIVTIPGGRHRMETATKIFPQLATWLNTQLSPYVPVGYSPTSVCKCAPQAAVRVYQRPTVFVRPDGRPPIYPNLPIVSPVPGLPIPASGPGR